MNLNLTPEQVEEVKTNFTAWDEIGDRERTVGGFHYAYYEEGKVYERNFPKKKSAAKRVLCEETGIIYDSMMEASQATGIHFKNISAACRRKNGMSGNFHWSFLNKKGGKDES